MNELTGQLTTLLFVLTGMMLTPIIFIALDFWANGSTYNVSNDDFSDFLILLRQHDKNNVTVDINGPCEIAALTFETKSY